MRAVATTGWISISALIALSCTPENKDRCGDDSVWRNNGCYEKDTGSSDGDGDTDLDTGADSGPVDYDKEQWIGASCACEGDECLNAGAPVPNKGLIVGCEDVPTNWSGADKSCLRSYNGALAPKTYYANGYCSILSTLCEGDDLICSAAVMGDYEAMTACPAGTAMIQSTNIISISTMTATIQNKICALLCGEDTDCRNNETDPVFSNEATQYQCLENSGVRFCQDPRNLPEGYSVQAY